MQPSPHTFGILLLVSALATAIAAYLAAQRREAASAGAVVIMMIATTWWATTYGLHLLHAPRPSPFFWARLMYVGVVAVPASLLVFALLFTGRQRWVTRRMLAALAVEPVMVLALIATEDWHHFFFAGSTPIAVDDFVGGPGFWLHSLYSYALVLLAVFMLVQYAIQAPRPYRRQSLLLLFGAVMPTIGSIATVFGLVDTKPGIDLTAFGFAFSGAAMVYNLYHHGLLDLIPIARDAMVERMTEGVVVLDSRGRVVDINPAARDMVAVGGPIQIGQPVSEWVTDPGLADRFLGQRLEHTEQVTLTDGSGRTIDMRVTAIGGARKGRRRSDQSGRLIVLRDITALKEIESELRDRLAQNEALQEQLRQQAVRDPLTGLYNRRFMEETLQREIARTYRAGCPLSVAIIDLDHFKRVNDTFGHSAGDRVLVALARTLQSQSRSGDAVCRYGGEEFVLILPGASLSEARDRIDFLRNAFARAELAHGDGAIRVTFSAGVAAFPQDGDNPDALLRNADRALYAAKIAGRNRVEISGTPAASA